MLYIVSGQARSGKDTSVEIFKNIIESDNETCITIAYADFLKEILGKCFNLTHEQLYGKLKESPIEGLNRNTGSFLDHSVCWTPRELLQYIGTDVMRNIDPYCWINVVKNFVDTNKNNYDNIILSDARFSNEVTWVLEHGGIHVHIQKTFRDKINGSTHYSETSLPNIEESDNTFIINNDGSLDDLTIKLENIWRKQNGRV